MDSKTFAIGVLSTTAVILLSALVIVYASPAPVMASGGMTVSGGEYVMTVGTNAGDQEFVYMIDTVSERLIVYRFDNTRKRIVLAHGLSLSDLRGEDNNPRTPGRAPSRRRP